MYRRPKFLEIVLEIREEMARDADYDADLFAEMVRSGKSVAKSKMHKMGDDTDGSPDTKSRSRRPAKQF